MVKIDDLSTVLIKVYYWKSVVLCVMVDRMRISGELPSLSVTMSDIRLCDILSLVSSIPLPQGAPPAVNADEDLHQVSSAWGWQFGGLCECV